MKRLKPSKLNFTTQLLAQRVKSLYITAPHSGAGTTTCAYALATAVHQTLSENILLIDGHLSKNSLTEHLALKNKLGFSDLVIAGGIGELNKAINGNTDNRLDIISTGQFPIEAPLGEERPSISLLLKSLLEQYTYIIYDAPPVHTPNETLALAAMFDATLLVLESDQTRWEVAEAAKEKLIQAGANVMGTIFNKRHYYVPQWLYNLF